MWYRALHHRLFKRDRRRTRISMYSNLIRDRAAVQMGFSLARCAAHLDLLVRFESNRTWTI